MSAVPLTSAAVVGLDGEVVAQRGRAGLAVGHELGHAEAGRAVERDDVDGQVLVDGGGVVLLAAGGEGEHHDDGQQHRREFAQMGHCRSLLFVLPPAGRDKKCHARKAWRCSSARTQPSTSWAIRCQIRCGIGGGRAGSTACGAGA